MSIEREGELIVFCCDDTHCHEIIRTETDDFGTAREIASENGWRFRNVNGVWQHFCPDEDLDGLEL